MLALAFPDGDGVAEAVVRGDSRFATKHTAFISLLAELVFALAGEREVREFIPNAATRHGAH